MAFPANSPLHLGAIADPRMVAYDAKVSAIHTDLLATIRSAGLVMPAESVTRTAASALHMVGGDLNRAWSWAYHSGADPRVPTVLAHLLAAQAEAADPQIKADRLRREAIQAERDATRCDDEAIYRQGAADRQREQGRLDEADANQATANMQVRLRDGYTAKAAKLRAEADEIEDGLEPTGGLLSVSSAALLSAFGPAQRQQDQREKMS
jgi:hypothetical protein